MRKKLTKLLLVLVLALTTMLAMATTANAEIVGSKAKGTVWEVNTDTGVLKIDVEGPMGSWTQGSQPWYKYRNYITEIQFPSATSKITNYAFSDLVNLEKIELPNSVEEIGDYAFLNCAGVKEIYIPISIANWGGYVFKDCVSVGYIFTENTTDINMTAPIWDASVGSKAADGYVELQIESKSIGQYAFYGLSSVTNVKLPTTLTGINDYAFYGFTSPFALNLSSATNIGKYAFYGCTGVTTINLPVATNIGEYAFYGCTGADSINIPVATTIGDNAFENCSGAKKITVGATSVNYGNEVFKNCSGCQELYLGAIGFKQNSNAMNGMGSASGFKVTLGKAITSINGTLQATYIGTTKPISLTLEEGSKLTSVGASAFEGNSMLSDVDFSNAGAVSYGEKAFNNCSNIRKLSSNSGETSLKSLSFGNLKKLEELNWNAITTNLGWAPADIAVSRTLGATKVNSIKTTDLTTDLEKTYQYGGQHYRLAAIKYAVNLPSQTLSTANVTYSFSGENTGNHPFFQLGGNTSSGTNINIKSNSIPSYMFTSGIEMVETASNISSTVSISTTLNASLYLSGKNMNVNFSDYTYPASWGYNTAAQKVVFSGSGKVTTNVSSGTKASYKTGIKINRVDSSSNNLTSIGENVLGTINYDLKTSFSDFATPTLAATGTPRVITSSTKNELGYTNLTSAYPWIIYRWDQNASSGQNTTYAFVYTGNNYYSCNNAYGYTEGITESSNRQYEMTPSLVKRGFTCHT